MSRRSRRLRVRSARAAAVVCSVAVLYQRWRLRSFGLHTSAAYRPASPSSSPSPSVEGSESTAPSPRAVRWQQLSVAATPENPFDLLVVGAGLTGLYTAVDAAQRGLRVALVDAADIGGGSTTSAMPTISPGALPYVQRAIRQRDTAWLRVAMTVMAEETTWGNVASSCVRAPGGVLQWVQSGLRRVTNTVTGVGDGQARGGGEQPETTKMLLPALHSSEMLEYACATILSTFLSILCGPLRPASILTTANVEARLPALSHHTTNSSSSGSSSGNNDNDAAGKNAKVRVKGGVVTRNLCLDGNAAAAALATTAAELGVVLCTCAPVVKIAAVPGGADEGSSNDGERREVSGWSFRPAAKCKGSVSSSLMVAQVHDALAAPRQEHPLPAASPSSTGCFFSHWFSIRTQSVATPVGAASSSSTSSSSTTAVYARAIVNCAGCDVDVVKSCYDGNTQDTVPAAFAGFAAYSYLVAPTDAVHATRSDDDASLNGAAPPLPATLYATGLHFSSPRLSFASAMVLPWRDRCVLLGPSITPLAHGPTAANGDATSRDESPMGPTVAQRDGSAMGVNGVSVIQSTDGYAAQRDRVVAMLASCGVTVDTSRLLACISQTVPYVRSPKEVPFQQSLLLNGYALHFSSLPVNEASESSSSNTTTTNRNTTREVEEERRVLPLLHVYGGSPVWARRIAEDVVDALVSQAALAETVKTQSLHGCRTHRLRLSVPPSMRDEEMSAVTRLEALVSETHAERLTDIVARRTHVAYTSPEDAMHALPSIGAVMGKLKGWSREREEAEVDAARRFIASVAVASSPAVV